MRLMTGVAQHTGGMLGGGHLREGFGFSCVLLMAAPAEVGDIGEFGHAGDGVVGVFGLGAVASFAGDVRVFAGRADLGFLVVAEDALALPGIGNGTAADGIERGRAVVTIAVKGLGDDGGANEEEESEADQKNGGGTD
jgi:hypothetical protein